MCGSNHLEESDRRPLEFCPECEAKVWWATGADPGGRDARLADFCRRAGLAREAARYEELSKALSPTGS